MSQQLLNSLPTALQAACQSANVTAERIALDLVPGSYAAQIPALGHAVRAIAQNFPGVALTVTDGGEPRFCADAEVLAYLAGLQ